MIENFAFSLGDSEYMAIFHQIILPLAYEFSPELVLVSAGFDAAFGCPEGCMRIMPATYGHMIRSVKNLTVFLIQLIKLFCLLNLFIFILLLNRSSIIHKDNSTFMK
jgi:acetoin utilization deacetylase AcuC-like enzyme